MVAPEQVSNSWRTYRDLALAVEVISPSSRRIDRQQKRRLYQRHRVQTYWIVDHEAELVEIWRPDDERPEIAAGSLTWCPPSRSGAAELHIDVPSLFQDLPALGV